MKKIFMLLLLLFLTVVMVSCGNGNEKDAARWGKYVKISPEETKAALAADKHIILVDVRSDVEYAEKHIPGAILLSDYYIPTLAPSKLPNKNAKIIVYCQSGRRSETAARVLLSMGYRYVSDLGGIVDWPYETVSGEQ